MNETHEKGKGDMNHAARLIAVALMAVIGTSIVRAESRTEQHFRNWAAQERALLESYRDLAGRKEYVAGLRSAYEAAQARYHQAVEPQGWWDVSAGAAKRRARLAMDRAHRELRQAETKIEAAEIRFTAILRSTPDGDRLRRLRPFQANTEALDLRNCLLTLKATAEAQGVMLGIDRKNSLSAQEYYQFYGEMLGYAQALFTAFIERAEGAYRDHLKNRWGEWLRHERELRRSAALSVDAQNRELLLSKADEAARVVAEMPGNLRVLAEQHAWAKVQLARLRDKKQTVSLLENHARLAVSTEEVVTGIRESRLSLDFEEPPLVEFTVDIDSLRLQPSP